MPEVFDQKAHIKKYLKEYNQRPDVKEKRKAYMKEYNQRPEVAEKRREYMRQYQARKRAERSGNASPSTSDN